jgi:hypothetical protein
MLQESDNGQQTYQPSVNPDFQAVPDSSLQGAVDAVFESGMAGQIEDIFDQIDPVVSSQFQSEIVASLDSRTLYAIGNKILAARKYRMDTHFPTHNDRQNGFISSVAKVIFGREPRRFELLDDADQVDVLRNQESAVAATIFGPMMENDRFKEVVREFIFDTRIGDRDSWFFHQVVLDKVANTESEVTLHYEVHPMGVLRISSDPAVQNEFITGKELQDFKKSAEMYHELVNSHIYAKAPHPNTAWLN